MPVIEFDYECPSCKGSGIYVGFAEKNGAGVKCHNCDKGKAHFKMKYKEFTRTKKRKDVTTVYARNLGYVLSPDVSSGGVPYEKYLKEGEKTLYGKEQQQRDLYCPSWYWQSHNYKLKPDWEECICCGTFTDCKHFEDKGKCWEKFDIEHPEL